MPVLQVKISGEQMEVLRGYARAHGATMTEVVGRWIDELGRGRRSGTNSGTNSASNGDQWSSGGGVLEELRKQTALLEALAGGGGVAVAESGEECAPAAAEVEEELDEGVDVQAALVKWREETREVKGLPPAPVIEGMSVGELIQAVRDMGMDRLKSPSVGGVKKVLELWGVDAGLSDEEIGAVLVALPMWEELGDS